MILTAKQEGGWENPKPGMHQAVCVDEIEKKDQETNYGKKDQVWLVFLLDQPLQRFDVAAALPFMLDLRERWRERCLREMADALHEGDASPDTYTVKSPRRL